MTTFTPAQRDAWKAEKRDEVSSLSADLKRHVTAMHSSEHFQRWLSVQSRFHHYSFRNTLLILMQMPDATQIAGFQTWKSMGRMVSKGQHGIRIFAPSPFKINKDTAEEQTIAAFRPVSVFDISQTEGADLPSIETKLSGDAPEQAIAQLTMLCAARNLKLRSLSDTGGAHGWYDHAAGEIVLNSQDGSAQQCKTLIHELAHHSIRSQYDTTEWERGDHETAAEGCAYVVSAALGLDTSSYSFGYIASWASEDGTARIERAMTTIQKIAHSILDALNNEED
jgi:hypothetical protein